MARKQTFQQHRARGLVVDPDDPSAAECLDDLAGPPFVAGGSNNLEDDGIGTAGAESDQRGRGFGDVIDRDPPVARVRVEPRGEVLGSAQRSSSIVMSL